MGGGGLEKSGKMLEEKNLMVQLTGRIFTTRCDPTRSWTPGDEPGGAQDSAATFGAAAVAVAANTCQMMVAAGCRSGSSAATS